MLDTTFVVPDHDVATQILMRMAWFRHELAIIERSELDGEELASIRRAIQKSLMELETLYASLD